jgi:hypothetical protein
MVRAARLSGAVEWMVGCMEEYDLVGVVFII